jgi:hypothetical protein
MPKTSTYKAICRKCNSPVYYYPAKLLLETSSPSQAQDETNKRIVDCTCTGEEQGVKHTLSYNFPEDFIKLN